MKLKTARRVAYAAQSIGAAALTWIGAHEISLWLIPVGLVFSYVSGRAIGTLCGASHVAEGRYGW